MRRNKDVKNARKTRTNLDLFIILFVFIKLRYGELLNSTFSISIFSVRSVSANASHEQEDRHSLTHRKIHLEMQETKESCVSISWCLPMYKYNSLIQQIVFNRNNPSTLINRNCVTLQTNRFHLLDALLAFWPLTVHVCVRCKSAECINNRRTRKFIVHRASRRFLNVSVLWTCVRALLVQSKSNKIWNANALIEARRKFSSLIAAIIIY